MMTMVIKILGPGCANCRKMEEMTMAALNNLGIQAEVQKVTSLEQISRYIMATPGLVIDEVVKHFGKPLPSQEKIEQWIQESLENS